MPNLRLRRSLPVLALLAGLVLPLSPASALPVAAPHHSFQALGSSVWTWLTHLFQAAWEKNGMAIDPNGQPAAAAPPGPQGDNGSQPDPNGQH